MSVGKQKSVAKRRLLAVQNALNQLNRTHIS